MDLAKQVISLGQRKPDHPNACARSRVGMKRVDAKTNPSSTAAAAGDDRERMRQQAIENVPPGDLFDHADKENRQETADLLRRGVIRRATPAEITRIRTKLRV